MKRVLATAAIAAFSTPAFVLSGGCGGGGDDGPQPVVMTGVTVNPPNPSIQSGNTQQFTATANYSDGSSQPLTGADGAWLSSNLAVATISLSGLATAASNGQSTISFTVSSNAMQGSATLTVTASPVMTITTTSLPSGTVGAPYSQAIEISGGTGPYACTTLAGSLPPNLSWTSPDGGMSWRLSGNPSAAGTYNFTLRATDGSTPQLSDTQDYTVVISGGTTTTTLSTTSSSTSTTTSTTTTTTTTSTTTPSCSVPTWVWQ